MPWESQFLGRLIRSLGVPKERGVWNSQGGCCCCCFSCVRLCVTPWTAAYQAPQSMGFSRQEYWSGLPLPSLFQGGGKNKLGFCFFFFPSTFLGLKSHKTVFSLSLELMIRQQTTQFKFCTKDYITTMYPAWRQFLLSKNLLANPVILKCKLWEWV